MRKLPGPSYVDYLNSLANTHQDELEDFSQYLKENTAQQYFFEKGPDTIYLHDYQKKQYRFVTPNVRQLLGYCPDAIMEGGSELLLHLFQPDDLVVFSNELFKTILLFLKNVPATEYEQYRFSFNYRLKHKNGAYCHMLQQGTYLRSTPDGKPLFSFSTISDISTYKADTRMILKIEHINAGGFNRQVLTNYYFPDPEEKMLSRREMEILKWIIDGLNSETIAQKLNTSCHTIKTHRKHILKKTNAKNTADLVRYAVCNGLLSH